MQIEIQILDSLHVAVDIEMPRLDPFHEAVDIEIRGADSLFMELPLSRIERSILAFIAFVAFVEAQQLRSSIRPTSRSVQLLRPYSVDIYASTT